MIGKSKSTFCCRLKFLQLRDYRDRLQGEEGLPCTVIQYTTEEVWFLWCQWFLCPEKKTKKRQSDPRGIWRYDGWMNGWITVETRAEGGEIWDKKSIIWPGQWSVGHRAWRRERGSLKIRSSDRLRSTAYKFWGLVRSRLCCCREIKIEKIVLYHVRSAHSCHLILTWHGI